MISIIVPVYRTSKYIKKCIDSILQQTYRNFELLLVDDGSDDDCSEILDDYIFCDDRIIVVHKKNEGVSKARNIGLELATGDYVTFIDSDDSVSKNYLEEMISIMQNDTSVSLVICNCNNEKTNEIYKDKEHYTQKNYMKLCDGFVAQAACGKLYLSSVIYENNIRVDSCLSLAEDFLFNTQYVNCIGSGMIVVISAPLYKYNVREGSLSNSFRSDYLVGNLAALSFLKTCLINWSVDENSWQLYYNLLYRMYEFALANIMYADANISNKERIKLNNSILKSKDFMLAVRKTSLKINPIYRLSYRLHRYEIFYCFEKIRKRKG